MGLIPLSTVPAADGLPEVRYLDLRHATGLPGLAMAWTDTAARLRVSLLLDGLAHGVCALHGRHPGRTTLPAAIRETLADHAGQMAQTDVDTSLRTACPGPGPMSEVTASYLALGLAEAGAAETHARLHREAARAAVRAVAVSDAMRAALLDILDHGVPKGGSQMDALRRRARSPLWGVTGYLAAHPALSGCLDDGRVSDLVAAGRPMREAVLSRWPGLTEAHLRRMRGVRDLGEGSPGFGLGRAAPPASTVMEALCAVPPDWTPRGARGWGAFAILACCATTLAARGGLPVAGLLRPSRGDWEGYLDRMPERPRTGAGAVIRTDDLRMAMYWQTEDTADAARALRDDLLLPVLAHVQAGRGTAPEALRGCDPWVAYLRRIAGAGAEACLYGGKGLLQVYETSARWHARQDRMGAAIRGAGTAVSWPPLLTAAFEAGDGVTVVPIADSVALRDEGAHGPGSDGVPGLSHCIASRMPYLLAGEAHALSVRRILPGGRWGRLSSVQVRLRTDRGAACIEVDEHRGLGNAAPPPEAVRAVESLVASVAAGLAVIAPEALPPRDCPGLDEISEACGYDWRDADALAEAARAWAPLLPRWLRELDPEAIVASLVARGMMEGDWDGSVMSET